MEFSGPSSNGRTNGFGPFYEGSNPSGPVIIIGQNMPGFWVNLYHDVEQTTINGYLYCCNTCSNVIRLQEKTDREKCPKCGDVIKEET